MKKTLIMILVAIITMTANAKTIHWLTFVDTTDKWYDELGRQRGVGEMDKVGRKVLYSKFINVVNAALAEKGYTSDIQDYWDTSTSPENCKKAVNNLSCAPEDIVVFYYIGHGGRPEKEDVNAHPFPQMFLAQNSDSRLIPLEWVHNTLKSKGARLTITIGMCCNVKDPNMTIKNAPSFHTTVNYGNAFVASTGVHAIQELFLENTGDLIATSASPSESSWGAVGFGDFGGIDDYTACFVDLFNQRAESGKIEWKSFFNEVGLYVKEVNKEMRRPGTQTPIFRPNISSASQPRQQQREEPNEKVEKKDQTQKDERTDDGNNTLSQYFDYIIDKKVPLGKRVALANELKKAFTGNATIKVLGQDVDQVIDKESVDIFFNRISTSRILLKVVPVDGKFTSDDRLSEMRVREYYKK